MSSPLRILSNSERVIWQCTLLAIIGWSALALPAQASDAHDILVVSGDAGPDQFGVNNGTFSSFAYGPHLNNAGQVFLLVLSYRHRRGRGGRRPGALSGIWR